MSSSEVLAQLSMLPRDQQSQVNQRGENRMIYSSSIYRCEPSLGMQLT
jgi:hypothetical protein